ncbi:Carbonic anhydrase [Operophtera brumata]|uniref:Carbonic anhydrase n=1 Tax=Operophtera brumata TaxID=104452 RepID=A0A0L7L7D8_OPEBR|nr:Carbonic anhydrase [Operophtera brumata]
MHFHWSVDNFTGCEHVLDGHGKYESIEAAVGHPDGLAVVGFLFETVDAPNPRFDKLVQGLEGIKKRDSVVHVTSGNLCIL